MGVRGGEGGSAYLTFSETLRALSISSFLVNESLGLHCRAPALVTRPVQLKPSSPTCFLIWEPIWGSNREKECVRRTDESGAQSRWGIANLTHLVILSSHRCIFGLVGQVAKLVSQFVGQSSEVVRVGVGLSHLRKDEKIHELTSSKENQKKVVEINLM